MYTPRVPTDPGPWLWQLRGPSKQESAQRAWRPAVGLETAQLSSVPRRATEPRKRLWGSYLCRGCKENPCQQMGRGVKPGSPFVSGVLPRHKMLRVLWLPRPRPAPFLRSSARRLPVPATACGVRLPCDPLTYPRGLSRRTVSTHRLSLRPSSTRGQRKKRLLCPLRRRGGSRDSPGRPVHSSCSSFREKRQGLPREPGPCHPCFPRTRSSEDAGIPMAATASWRGAGRTVPPHSALIPIAYLF